MAAPTGSLDSTLRAKTMLYTETGDSAEAADGGGGRRNTPKTKRTAAAHRERHFMRPSVGLPARERKNCPPAHQAEIFLYLIMTLLTVATTERIRVAQVLVVTPWTKGRRESEKFS